MWQALDWRGGNPVVQALVTRWTGAQSIASVFEQLNTKGRFSELLQEVVVTCGCSRKFGMEQTRCRGACSYSRWDGAAKVSHNGFSEFLITHIWVLITYFATFLYITDSWSIYMQCPWDPGKCTD